MPSSREEHAVKDARIGDFEPLAQLVQEGHEIETEDARKIIAKRIREAAEDIDSTEEAASKTKPPKPGTTRKKGSTIGLRCTTKVKLIALRAQEIRAANTISDSIEMAILKDAADLGIKEAADLLLEIDIIDGLELMASYCEKRPAAREVEGVPIYPEKITEDELNDLILLLKTAREEMINLRGKIKRLERMER